MNSLQNILSAVRYLPYFELVGRKQQWNLFIVRFLSSPSTCSRFTTIVFVPFSLAQAGITMDFLYFRMARTLYKPVGERQTTQRWYDMLVQYDFHDEIKLFIHTKEDFRCCWVPLLSERPTLEFRGLRWRILPSWSDPACLFLCTSDQCLHRQVKKV